MASNSAVQQQSTQHQYMCKECGLAFNSAESLDVHLQYHESNLLQQWAVKSQTVNEEKNNNMKHSTGFKREFAIQSDSVDKKSPESQRSPEAVYGHPPTPQSYQSGSSPYQNNENSTFSPNYPNYSVIKSEASSPNSQQQQQQQLFQSTYSSSNTPEQQQQQQPQFFGMDNIHFINQDMHNNKVKSVSNFRYHPYDRPQFYQSANPVADENPAYPPQPTPSPSPKHCEKCGYVCQTPALLIEHMNLTHPNTQVQPQYNQNNSFAFNHHHHQQQQQQQQPSVTIKEEEVSPSDILDLDSHKVVHPAWADDKQVDKRLNGEPLPTLLNNSWSATEQHHPIIFQGGNSMYLNQTSEQKMFSLPENKIFASNEQKIFNPHQTDNQNFLNNSVVTSSNADIATMPSQSYRPFDHLSNSSNASISSSQVSPVSAATPDRAPTSTKSANWKSNEARRPKTYNCTACNKWFTSSGHLKRHYNTTLHKNAVKSSGQPDPATMPISAHHHPARDSAASKDNGSSSNSPPREDSRSDDGNGLNPQYDNRLGGGMPGLLQHPPNGSYDRQSMHHNPASLGQHHTTLVTPTPLGGHMMPNHGFSNISNGSPPNGDAGLSQADPRGLLSMPQGSHNFNMMPQPHMLPMEASQFPMYPNELAPHVSQATDITSHNITGEQVQFVVPLSNQPLPSFAHIQAHRFSSVGYANVGGMETATAPTTYTYFTAEGYNMSEALKDKEHEGNNNEFLILNDINDNPNTNNQQQQTVSNIVQYSPNNNNNINFVQLSDQTNMFITADMSQSAQNACSPSEAQQEIPEQVSIKQESKENILEDSTEAVSDSSPEVSPSQEDLSKTKCFDCDKVFNRPCYLTQHNKTCHAGEKPFKCPRCGKRFATEEIYLEHSRKHAGNKPYKCELCPKMFNHKTDLRRHICCHTGRKPYACKICNKGFIRKDHMVKHMDTHQRKKVKLSAMRN